MTTMILKNPAETLAKMKRVPPAPLAAIFESRRTRLEDIARDARYTDHAKQEMAREVTAKAQDAFTKAFDELLASELRGLDQEEGAIRAELLDEFPSAGTTDGERLTAAARLAHQGNRLTRVNTDVQIIAMTQDLGLLAEQLDLAELAGDAFTTSRIGAAVVARAHALAEHAEGGVLGTSAAAQTARELRTRVEAWRKAHPSPAARLRDLTHRRALIALEWQDARSLWLQAYDWPEGREARFATAALRG